MKMKMKLLNLIMIIYSLSFCKERFITIQAVIDSIYTETTLYLQKENIGDTIEYMFLVDESRQSKNEVPLYQYINGRTIHTYYAQLLSRSVISHQNAEWNENYIRCGYKIQPDTNMIRFYEDSKIDETEWYLTINSSIYDFHVEDSIQGVEGIDNSKYSKSACLTFQGYVKRISTVGVKIENNKLLICPKTSTPPTFTHFYRKYRTFRTLGDFQVFSINGAKLGNTSYLNNLSNGVYILRRIDKGENYGR